MLTYFVAANLLAFSKAAAAAAAAKLLQSCLTLCVWGQTQGSGQSQKAGEVLTKGFAQLGC